MVIMERTRYGKVRYSNSNTQHFRWKWILSSRDAHTVLSGGDHLLSGARKANNTVSPSYLMNSLSTMKHSSDFCVGHVLNSHSSITVIIVFAS